MVHAYHLIFGTYGFWLPNDPRGSWSDFVGKWELVRFGKSTRSTERRELTEEERQQQRLAKQQLKYDEVTLTGEQALAAANGFKHVINNNHIHAWACSIMPQHVHMVLARHNASIEQTVIRLKSEATKQFVSQNIHPMEKYRNDDRVPRPWSRGCWKVYLEDEQSIFDAIDYVKQNPLEEDMPAQNWSFIRPFNGLEHGWNTYTR